MPNYAKLIDGRLEYAPSHLLHDGYYYSNPPGWLLEQFGYKEIVYDDRPDMLDAEADSPSNFRPVYTEEADRIRVGWEAFTPEPVPTASPEELREMAYKAEADQYLIAYQGYLAEGDSNKAEEQRALYLAKKTEIRAKYPDNLAY